MSTPRLHTFEGIGDIVVRLDTGREIYVPAVRALDFDGGVAVITWAGATPLTYSSVLEVVSVRFTRWAPLEPWIRNTLDFDF